ncbi:MAG: CHAT domain-containing protein [Aphanothece sp. CMT-3BRIN-NPC111]|jgi:WD40 repeat protein|nr:CHAT domain-containing protein [Aphanothece sp. CMT-3BRIN-NPC111]
MSQLVVLNLGKGNWQQGFSSIVAQLWQTDSPNPMQFIGGLPAAQELEVLYQRWQQLYETLYLSLGWRRFNEPGLELESDFEIDEEDVTHVSQAEFDNLCQQLQHCLNNWLNGDLFRNIDRQLRTRLIPNDEIRFIITAESDSVLRLPWCLWHFFEDYPKAELALSPQEYSRSVKAFSTASRQKKVRMLAILGDRQGIDIAQDRQLLEQLSHTDIKFLVEPNRSELTQQLWESGWDILFFAGHSSSQGKGRMQLNQTDTLTIDQLRYGLRKAIAQGLKLAIFNSCDGLGLALDLADLHIPEVIVMREPVPDLVAQEFLKHFLIAFSEGQSLYMAVREARERLQALEDEFPCATWLPVICQNPAVEPPTWLQLGGILPCPYKGLFAFREEDAHLFFGREQFIQDVVTAVNRKPLVAVVGPSGSGKSSVVFAGLVPKLRLGEQGFTPPQIVSFRPGNNPFEALAAALAPLWQERESQIQNSKLPERHLVEQKLATLLRQNDKALYKIVESLVQVSTTRLVLIADQFEELYTLCPESEREPFLNKLLEAVRFAPAFTLVMTLRADFYGAALSYRPLSDALQGAIHNLGPMSRSELQSAIKEPAARMQVRLEPELIDKLIDNVWGQAGRLPLLEFALTQLWSKQRQGWLTDQAYLEIGGVEAALANHAEAVYAQFSEADRQRTQQVFMQLVHLGEHTEATRRLATRNEVKEENWDLVTRLASSRLVVTNRNESTGNETVEIAHEALIKNWERLRHWLRLDGEFRSWQEQLRMARRQWENSGSDEGALLRGKSLADAEYWQQQRPNQLSDEDRSFLELSLALRDREIKKQKRRRQLTISSLTGGLIGALILTGIALWQWQNSVISESEAISKSSRLLSGSGQEFEALKESIRSARKLQQASWTQKDSQLTSQVVGALLEALYGVRERNRLEGHQGAVYSVSYSPDGQTLASASADKTIKLWRKDGTAIATLTGHQGAIYSVSFSPDGQTLASASTDQTIKLWRKDGTAIATLTGHQGAIYSVSFSPDGQTLASASADKTIKLWRKDGTLIKTLIGHQGEVRSVSFSPDGQTLASASADKTIKLWRRDGTLLKTLTSYTSPFLSITFSPDSQVIATTSEDGSIQFWNKDGKLIKRWFEEGIVHRVIFSSNGQTIVTAGGDTTVKLWNFDGTLLQTFQGHTDGVFGVAFSPDGQTLTSASADGTIKFWNQDSLLSHTLQGHNGDVETVVFSPDGQTLASASADRTIKLWSRDGTLLKTLRGHTDVVHGLNFSPDGQTLASASWDKTIKLWSRDGTLLKTLRGHTGNIYMANFSPDAQTLASASGDGTIKFWSRDGALLKTLRGHTDVVHAVSFSRDGQLLASASHDRTVKLWSRDGTLLNTLRGHTNWVHAVSFSPDGQQLASASHDRTVKLWSRDGKLLRTIVGHADKVLGISFSSDGQILASSSRDKTVKLWHLDGREIATLRGHDKWVHGISFSPDSPTLASASDDKTVIMWNLENLNNLDGLLGRGCDWLHDYLKNNINVHNERSLCDGIIKGKVDDAQ